MHNAAWTDVDNGTFYYFIGTVIHYLIYLINDRTTTHMTAINSSEAIVKFYTN
jgi:hypothetical protein